MSITLSLTPWAPFHARKKDEEIHRWLRAVGDASERAFKGGMRGYPPASSPGQYPAIRTGRLMSSIRYRLDGANSVTIGSNTPYSRYLRQGTSRMERRKMSDNALQEGIGRARLGRWVEWSRT
jgi:hypothetical protein